MSDTINAFGREWAEEDMSGLVGRLASSCKIAFCGRLNGFCVHVGVQWQEDEHGLQGVVDDTLYGTGPTPWLALCDAMKGDSNV